MYTVLVRLLKVNSRVLAVEFGGTQGFYKGFSSAGCRWSVPLTCALFRGKLCSEMGLRETQWEAR